MRKCDFNKFAKQLSWNHTLAWVPYWNLLHNFRTPFLKNTSEWLLLYLQYVSTGAKSHLYITPDKYGAPSRFVVPFSKPCSAKVFWKQVYSLHCRCFTAYHRDIHQSMKWISASIKCILSLVHVAVYFFCAWIASPYSFVGGFDSLYNRAPATQGKYWERIWFKRFRKFHIDNIARGFCQTSCWAARYNCFWTWFCTSTVLGLFKLPLFSDESKIMRFKNNCNLQNYKSSSGYTTWPWVKQKNLVRATTLAIPAKKIEAVWAELWLCSRLSCNILSY